MRALRKLQRPALLDLAQAFESGRLRVSGAGDLSRYLPSSLKAEVEATVARLSSEGMSRRHLAQLLRLLADERAATQAALDRVELVWSGLEVVGAASRDTAVVAQALFREAKRELLVASFALDRGAKSEAIFGALAERLDEEPGLTVRLVVNVHRKYPDSRPSEELIAKFVANFKKKVWPAGKRLPQVFHDPRSLSQDTKQRACMHAKCIVADDRKALVGSANFTEAAHERNIEAGVLIDDAQLARALRAQFDTLIERGLLERLPGL